MKQALLVIDVQNDYFKDGKLPLVNPELALTYINELEDEFIVNNEPIIYIQHIKQNMNCDFFRIGTKGAELHPKLQKKGIFKVITKESPNCFFETDLLNVLKELGVQQLVITGMMTHMCVDSTTRASKELNFSPILIADATATKNLKYHNSEVSAENVQISFLASLSNFAEILSTKDYIAKKAKRTT